MLEHETITDQTPENKGPGSAGHTHDELKEYEATILCWGCWFRWQGNDGQKYPASLVKVAVSRVEVKVPDTLEKHHPLLTTNV